MKGVINVTSCHKFTKLAKILGLETRGSAINDHFSGFSCLFFSMASKNCQEKTKNPLSGKINQKN